MEITGGKDEEKAYCKSIIQFSIYLKFKTYKTIILFLETDTFKILFALGNGAGTVLKIRSKV